MTGHRVVVSLSDHPYYLWQALVQAVELDRMGIDVTYLVYHPRQGPSARLTSLAQSGLGTWLAWPDWRKRKDYNPAMKPGLVARWLAEHPEQAEVPFALIDPDAIPTRPIMGAVSERHWRGTDTDSYTGPSYLTSKRGVWQMLCDLVGADPAAADKHGVGAQVLAVGQPAGFWQEVSDLSVKAYTKLRQSRTDVQAWCAEMYVTALVAAREGIDLVPDPDLSMVWANGPSDGWQTCGFFHDAGVTEVNNIDFHKGTHQVSPWGKKLVVSEGSASARYVELIRQAENLHPGLVWTH